MAFKELNIRFAHTFCIANIVCSDLLKAIIVQTVKN